MGEVTKPVHLRLVSGATASEGQRNREPVQGTLFPDSAYALVCIVHMPALSDDSFLSALEEIHPAFVFDLRTVPSFNMGRLNRHHAFEVFEGLGSRYIDVPGLVGAVSRVDTKMKASAMSEAIASAVRQSASGPCRVMALLDDFEAVSEAASELPRVLPERGKDPWQVQVIGGIRAS